ncbi:hypothetical protein TRIATDRAFT_255312 [Trichoderma atroviride IMI 206040]|uniref:Uncharacterized protein n=1 Tax=Hypocrea atroviridis (strain ATCC 20476 / IMI 206040) TaxID=452589 RepID=G9NKN5_HYPAI|nr:uncharacterized protein TRIATDRAFT_297987 [Trichoderma atroviride IMI 206040]EHK48457.1 hypothetical protein TRIATDRAFT_255312 [Trichoderma atroviride IMI 206040]
MQFPSLLPPFFIYLLSYTLWCCVAGLVLLFNDDSCWRSTLIYSSWPQPPSPSFTHITSRPGSLISTHPHRAPTDCCRRHSKSRPREKLPHPRLILLAGGARQTAV